MDIDMPPAWVSHDHWHARVLSEYPLLSPTVTRWIEILKGTKPLACTEALSGCPVSHGSNTETDASSTPLQPVPATRDSTQGDA
jgi:hypothetical protein